MVKVRFYIFPFLILVIVLFSTPVSYAHLVGDAPHNACIKKLGENPGQMWAQCEVLYKPGDPPCIPISPIVAERYNRLYAECVREILGMNSNCIVGTREIRDGEPAYCPQDFGVTHDHWLLQKEGGESCNQNFECQSNFCDAGSCRDIGGEVTLLQKVVKALGDAVKAIQGFFCDKFGIFCGE